MPSVMGCGIRGQAHINGYTDNAGNITDYGKFAGAVMAHGIAGCVTSVAGGGKCGPGALSAAISKAATPITAYKMDPVYGTIASAVIGGTASELGGGTFANGATTGAFSYIFNQLAPKSGESKQGNRDSSASGLSDQLLLAAGPQGLIQWESEPDNPYALRRTSGIFPAAIPGSPQELALATTVVMISGDAVAPREYQPATDYGLPGKGNTFYAIYSVGPPDNPGAERIATIPGSNVYYYSPYHYRPGPGAPNVWIRLTYGSSSGGG